MCLSPTPHAPVAKQCTIHHSRSQRATSEANDNQVSPSSITSKTNATNKMTSRWGTFGTHNYLLVNGTQDDYAGVREEVKI